MTTTLTPPPSGTPTAPSADTAAPPPPPRGSSRAVAIIAICLGAVLILGTAGGALLASIRSGAEHAWTLSATTTGVHELDVEVSGADVEIAFANVAEATLDVVGTGRSAWRLTRDSNNLVVHYEPAWWDHWRWADGIDRAVLTLPSALAGLNASLAVNGGSLQADGTFGDLDLDLNAGALTVNGSAHTLQIDVNAGSARLGIADAQDATVSVSAGQLTGKLTGAALTSLSIDVSAGRTALTVPDQPYALTREVSAGSFTHTLTAAPDARRHIDVTVSAGVVTLDAG